MMDSTGVILNSIVNDYENILNLSGEELCLKTSKIRCNLLQIIDQHLSDVDKISTELSKMKKESSHTQMVISFLHHLISHFPHPVFAPSTSQCAVPAKLENINDFNGYYDFLFHLLSNLVHLLSFQQLSSIHDEVKNLFTVLMQLIKTKNISTYKLVLTNLVNLSMELHTIRTKHFDVDSDVDKIQAVTIHSFSSKNHSNPLKITSYEELEHLQMSCSYLLQIHISDISQFTSNLMEGLYSAVLHQIDMGLLPLKSCALALLSQLLKHDIIPCNEGRQKLLYIATVLLEYVSVQQSSNIYLENGCCLSEIEDYDKSVGEYLEQLFRSSNDKAGILGANFPFCIQELEYLLGHVFNCLKKCCQFSSNNHFIITACQCLLSCTFQYLLKNGTCPTLLLSRCDRISLCLLQLDVQERSNGTTLQITSLLSYALAVAVLTTKSHAVDRSHSKDMDVNSTSDAEIKKSLSLSRKRPHSPNLSKPEVVEQDISDFLSAYQNLCGGFLDPLDKISKQHESKSLNLESVFVLSSKCMTIFEAQLHAAMLVKYMGKHRDLDVTTTLQNMFNKMCFAAIYIKLAYTLILVSDGFKVELKSKQYFVQLYENLVKLSHMLIAWLYIAPGMEQNCRNSFETCTILLSLPWVEDMEWLDLKAGQVFQSVSRALLVSKALRASEFSTEDLNHCLPTLSGCLKGLSLLPASMSSSWRCSVLLKWGLGHQDDTIINECLRYASYLCCSLQVPNSSCCVFLSISGDLTAHIKSIKKQEMDINKVLHLALLLEPLVKVAFNSCQLQTMLHSDCTESFSSVFCGSITKIYLHSGIMKARSVDNRCMQFFDLMEKFISDTLSYLKLPSGGIVNNVYRALISGVGRLLQFTNQEGMNTIRTRLLTEWFSYFKVYHTTAYDYSLVQAFVNVNDTDSKWNHSIVELVESMCRYTTEQHNIQLQCHAAHICSSIAHFCHSNSISTDIILYVHPLLCLCKLLCHCSSQVSSVAFLECEKLSKLGDKGSVMVTHRRQICEKVIECFIDAKFKTRPLLDVMEDLSQLYSTSLHQFIDSHQLYFVPPMVVSMQAMSRSAQKDLLKMFSETLGKPQADVIMLNFKHIFCYAVLHERNLNELFDVLENATRIKKDSMILLNYGSLIQHLVGHVSANVDRVCSALHVIQQIKSPDKKIVSLSGLLQPHFLSVLTFFNGQLRLPNVNLVEKKQICESILCLLKLMDKSHVTPVCVKIVNTLCLAQQVFVNSSYSSVCCKAWDTLVRCVDSSSLGSILSQVVVMLLPFLDEFPDQVAQTLEYLVIDSVEQTGEHLSELHFLPEHDALKRVQSFLAERLKDHITQQNFNTLLEQATKQVGHESSVVRKYALERLRAILGSHQSSLQRQALLGGSAAEPVRHLVSILLTCCRDANSRIRLLAVKCLGEIGAVTPDRLSLTTKSKEKERVCVHLSFNDEDFAHGLLTRIVQAFLAARPKHQDISAFAVQELLKIYQCQDGAKDCPGRRLWRRFPEQVRAVLEPHLSSRYMLKLAEINLSSVKKPVLHRRQNITFHEWIGTFCAVLMQMASSGADDASKVFRVSQACAGVVRNDINVALFLLPNLVLEVLRRADEYTNFVVGEVMAVLESTEQIKEPRSESAASTTSTPMLVGGEGKLAGLRGSPLSQLSAQAIFTVLDHVMQWQRQPAPSSGGTLAKTRHNREKELAAKFLARVPQKTLALVSLRCHAHSRALLHFENYLRHSCDGRVDGEAASFLQRVFVEMDETDGVSGVVAVRGVEPTPETQLKLLESTGALQDAAACYERIIRRNPDDLVHHKGFVKCLIDLGQSSTAASVIVGMLSTNPAWESELKPYQVEACWRLGEWDLLEKNLEQPTVTSDSDWSSGIGRSLLAMKDREWQKCRKLLDNLYLSQTGPLSAASMESGSYQRGYQHILRLHMLSDLEHVVEKLDLADACSGAMDDVVLSWQQRLRLVQPSFRAKEPMLSLQRAMLPLLSDAAKSSVEEGQRQLGRLWLQSSKIARKSGHLQTAYGALLTAQAFQLPEYCIEHSKWLWQKNESHQALLTLQRGFNEHFASVDHAASPEQRKTRAKVMLLVAKLMEQSSSFDSNTVLRQYKEVVSYMGEWEDSHFHCAKYYDKLMTTLLGENRGTAKANHLYYIMHHYGRSLCYGTAHIYESLTKLLTVWLDYGANAAKLAKAGKPQSDEDVQRLVDVISDLRCRLPAYVFYVAFSQLTSRICHQHSPTYFELKEMLVKVIQAFPQRTLWLMLAISKSSYKQRASRCQEIFQRVSFQDVVISRFVTDAIKLTNKLLELCNKPTSNVQPLSINTHFKSLKKLVEDPSFSKVMLPLQKFMTVSLPESKSSEKLSGSQASHDPFPDPAVHIVGFDDVVEILPSLQRPKKITIRASDGSNRIFLCKPKDDLRKDARLTEFAAIVNKCLKRDPECGRRQLQIRTYAVVPLNEECGLIEWVNDVKPFRVIMLRLYRQHATLCSNRELLSYLPSKQSPLEGLHLYHGVFDFNSVVPLNEECGLIEWVNNMQGLRHILLPIYKAKGLYTSGKQLKAWQLPGSETLQKKLQVFRTKLLPRHPPVFHEWFLTTFPDPSAWYNAKLAYSRSVAVMSMVGYILGLGDRHGENILFDSNSGEAMHVDFNCLFNKGLTLEVPEIVPFRLTHNMVDAMGPTKYEGFFRSACEVTMNVLREQREPLMSVLKTFIHDPLVEWSKRGRGGGTFNDTSGEIVNEKALSHINDIDRRLRGIVAKNKGLPLSIEGHVHYLIQEATDEEKLCQMYIGWAPFM